MRSLFLLIALFVAIDAAAAPTPPPAPAVGQIVDAKGKITLVSSVRGLKAELLTPLRKGDRLTTDKSGSVELSFFKDGGRFRLGPNSSARVEEANLVRVSGAAPQVLKKAWQPTQMASSASIRQLGLVIRGGDDGNGPKNASPDGTVRQTPIILRWDGPIPEGELQLKVQNPQGRRHQVTLKTEAREYALPDGVCEPGVNYVWILTAFAANGDPGASVSGGIRLLKPEEREALEALEAEVAAEREKSPLSLAPIVILASAYERLAMRTEAAQTLQEALKLRPNDTAIRARLLRLSPPVTRPK